MFLMPDDIERLCKHYYAYLPTILIFYSELFNSAVFSLFQDEVDIELYPKRVEKLTEIMNRRH